MLLYQDNIINKILSLNIDSFPRTLLIEGKSGSGKHLLVDIISEHLNLTKVDLTDNLNFDTIFDIALKVEPLIYFIDLNKTTEKQQNVILKFLEEPLKNSFIVCIIDDKNSLLPTVQNRCQIWTMQEYTKENLIDFAKRNGVTNYDEFIDLVNTPGDILKFTTTNIDSYITLAKTIFQKINRATPGNTLTISNKICFKDENDNIKIDIFGKILLRVAKENMINNEPKAFIAYKLTRELNNKLKLRNLDKKYAFENFLMNLRNALR